MESALLRHNRLLASNLLFGILTLSCLHIVVEAALSKPFQTHFVLPLLLNGLFFCLTLALRKGKQWATILFLLLFLLITGLKLLGLEQIRRAWQEQPLAQLTQTVYYLVMATALLLLFRKPHPPAVKGGRSGF